MIKVIIKGKEYDVPVSWDEVPFTKGVEVIQLIKQDNRNEILCLLIGIDNETLMSLKESSVTQLFILTEFFNDISILDNDEPIEKYKDFDYGSAAYGDTEAVKIVVRNNTDKDWIQIAAEVIKKLTGDDISNEPFSEIIGSVGFFLNQWISYTKTSQNLTNQKLTKEQNLQELEGSKGSEVLELG